MSAAADTQAPADRPPIEAARRYFYGLHERIAQAFAAFESPGMARTDRWERPDDSGLAGSGALSLIEGGAVFDRAGAALSDVRGRSLPAAASARHPELAGQPFQAIGVSVVVHPHNPYAPTSHMNVRLFSAASERVWWFGGGFDLTPVYPFDEDAVAWHAAAAGATAASGAHVYPVLKRTCDEYFYLRHRGETRGIGGLFVDDLNDRTPLIGGSFDYCFELIQRIGDTYLEAYLPIVERRRRTPFSEREQRFQWYRRGRYVEFNLVFDRGTLFGLQSGGRTESILMSMPPRAEWRYDYTPAPGTPEAKLADYLRPRDWLASYPSAAVARTS
jgi:coproporphyrinogen III oxidase